MEPIRVPGPPAEAFNKNRPVSDLIRAQVNHFKHLEYKLSARQRQGIPQHEISTEGDAAQYIAAMTAFLLAAPAPLPQVAPGPQLVAPRRPAPAEPAEGLAIAASAETEIAPGVPPQAAPVPPPKQSAPASIPKSGPGTKAGGSAPRRKQ